ncbi:MAG: hypothetical protein QOG83_2996 [Alphaproteobacteria bacterium]|jgi:hypothetical protein|nr:hypothetical protein [Alphaproteobacteria bacterium]
MPRTIERRFRLFEGLLLAALVLQGLIVAAGADELADFHAAVEEASAQYRFALKTLETRGREETSAEVARFRQAWQAVIDRFGSDRPPAFAETDDLPGLFMQVDTRIVGAMIVIDIGSRDAARDALAPIEEVLEQLSERSAPQPR